MARSKTRAWDELFDSNREVFQFGYDLKEIPLQLEHARTEIQALSESNLSIEQIQHLSELIYYVYRLGKDAK